MRLTHLLRNGFIELDFSIELDITTELGAVSAENDLAATCRGRLREALLDRLVDLLPESSIQNKKQLCRDLLNREKRASTALGHGIALPHVRTIHVKHPMMGFARLETPLDLGAHDDENVDLVFLLVGPAYDDKVYLRIYRQLGEFLEQGEIRQRLRAAKSEGEVLRALSS